MDISGTAAYTHSLKCLRRAIEGETGEPPGDRIVEDTPVVAAAIADTDDRALPARMAAVGTEGVDVHKFPPISHNAHVLTKVGARVSQACAENAAFFRL